ncbi:MAG: HPr family phosphocarrier protein [Balneolaceae bacterium]
MLKKKVTVLNEEGLHARPAASLVKLASKFKSDFYIGMQGYQVNGKSILGVMTLAAEHGAELELIIEGNDEKKAMESLVRLFENKFSSEE